ncbi:MAG: asparagine synthase-related protein, partial [Chloroflexota bacterium]|nr:asparagine synthase-related protein [Anaerolineales bacterium]
LRPELNRNTVAHFFALQVPEDGQTFFNGVSELLPAHRMTVDASGHTITRYWQPDPTKKLRFKTEKEYADHFLALLEESVRCRMRSITPIGVSMSGGLDSTSVACLAARMQSPQPLTAISNVYDELLECDEREYIDAVKAQYDIRSIRIPSDDAWTYKDWQSRLHNPNQPEGNLYRINKERNYQTAHNDGLRVVLTGGSGDRLYIAGREWLTDLLREGRFRDTLAGLALQIRSRGIRYTLSFGHVRISLQSLWQKFLPGLHRARRHKVVYPAWLHASLTGFLKKDKKDRSWLPPGLERYATLLGLMSAYGCSRETFIASRYELELRHPYRDRRLVEFMIGIPAYMLYRDGFYKHILRVAMQGILPESIRTRKRATFLSPLFLRGVERERAVLDSNLYENDRAWLQFVDARWVRKHLSVRRSSNKPGIALFVAWLCVSFEAWYGTFTQANEISGGRCDSRA